jgi:hypothetical protein
VISTGIFFTKKTIKMKKVLFAAIAACGFMGANAQAANTGEVVKVSSSTSTLADPATATWIGNTIQVYNIIRVRPAMGDAYEATFNTAEDLDNGKDLIGHYYGQDGQVIQVSSNRPYKVTLGATPVTKTGGAAPVAGQGPMPISVFKVSLETLAANMTTNANYTHPTYGDLASSIPDVLSSTYGAAQNFKVRIKANPGWNYDGGSYGVGIRVTATQE